MRPEPSGRAMVTCWNGPLAGSRPELARGGGQGGPLFEDGLAHAAGPVVRAVVDALESLDDVVPAAVLLCVLDDLLLRRRVVHAAEGLLDVDRAHHAPGLPREGCDDSRTGAVTVEAWRPGRSSGCSPTRCG